MTNCPNCGAPIQGPKCEYCGTKYFSPYETTINLVIKMFDAGIVSFNEARRMMGIEFV